MSHAITLDTLAVVKRLKAAGVPEQQAEAITETFREVQDVGLKQLVTRGDLQLEIEKIRREIADARAELIKWLFGVAAGQTALIIAVLKLFPGK